MNWESIRESVARIDREQYLVQGFFHMGLFERAYLLLGMEAALVGFLEQPEEMQALLNTIADFKIALIEAFDDAAKPDLIDYGDDWGTQSGLFMPPDVWRQVLKPPTKRLYDCLKARGILVHQHSCGKIEDIFGDMVEMGADIWNPCQPCNDLARLKREYSGRIIFCGEIDSHFVLGRPGATPEEVRAEVRKRIKELAARGGYIPRPNHSIPYRQKLLDAMNDEITHYGREFYDKERAN